MTPAFIAAERGSRYVAALVKRERERGRAPVTNGGVVAQDGDDVLTSDPAGLLDLARAAGTHLELISV